MDDTQRLNSFFRNLAAKKRGLLLLDYDGTLAPFVEDRLQAIPAPGIRERIDAILESGGDTRVVFVSGRPCEELTTLAGLKNPVEVWGCHGREFRNINGEMSYFGVTADLQKVLEKNREELLQIVPEDKLELKTGCLAFHWRGVPEEDRKRMVEQFEDSWHRIAEEQSLKVLYFDGGIELAIPGRTKGDAVNQLLEEHRGEDRATAFLGDDKTDEDGFRALGERGLSVLVRNEPRETSAHIRIPMPEGVLSFFDRWHAATQKGDI